MDINKEGWNSIRLYSELNWADSSYDSLKKVYPSFKSLIYVDKGQNAGVYIYREKGIVKALVLIKPEDENIIMKNGTMQSKRRLKLEIMAIKGREYKKFVIGALALALRYWRSEWNPQDEVYLAVSKDDNVLLRIVNTFGFEQGHEFKDGRIMFLKYRNSYDKDQPFTYFPFINPKMDVAFALPLTKNEYYKLFFDILLDSSGNKYFFDEAQIAVLNHCCIRQKERVQSELKPGTPIIFYPQKSYDAKKGNVDNVNPESQNAFYVLATLTDMKVLDIKDKSARKLILYDKFGINDYTDYELEAILGGNSNIELLSFLVNDFLIVKEQDASKWNQMQIGDQYPDGHLLSPDELKNALKLGGTDWKYWTYEKESESKR